MKPKGLFHFFTFFFLLTTSVFAFDFDQQHTKWTHWLQMYVKDGLVNYVEAQKSPAILEEYIKEMGSVDLGEFEKWTPNRQKAYWINLYNALVVQLVVQKYPIKSIKKIGWPLLGPWGKNLGMFLGEQRSLDDIEHDILRKKFLDERIHAVLVCASKSCPKLRRKAYVATDLDMQLDEAMKSFVNDEQRNKLDFESKTLVVSKIFKWYEKDFVRTHGTILKFFQKYTTSDTFQKANTDNWKVAYLPYDWSLNELKN